MSTLPPHSLERRSPWRFGAALLWAAFLLSAFLPLDAVWLSYGGSFFCSGSIDLQGIRWDYEGAPQMLLYMAAPYVNVTLGLILAYFYLPKVELWRPFRQLHLALCLVAGEGLLMAMALGPAAPNFGIHFDFQRTFAISVAEGLWFYGLLIESQRKRPIFAVLASSVLFAMWHTAFSYRPVGMGLDTDFGLHKAMLAGLAAVPFGIARYRGASVLSLIIANFLLSLLLAAYQANPISRSFPPFSELLPLCMGYLGLNLFLLTFPGSLRPLETVRYWRALVPGALVLITGVSPFLKKAHEPEPAPAEMSREEKRVASFRLLASEYPRQHIDFGKHISERAFRERCEQLSANTAQLSDFELLLEIRKLIAELHVDHSYVIHPSEATYPVRFEWLSDGLIVGPVDHPAADPRTKTLRVLRMGDLSPEQVEAMFAPFVSYENEHWLRIRAAELMLWPPLMHKLGIANPDGTLTLHCIALAGSEHELKIVPLTSAKLPPAATRAQKPRLVSKVAPEQLAEARGYWGGVLEEQPDTLYLRYDGAHGGKENPFGSFGEFVGAMMKLAESRSATRVIVDLRYNSGGYFNEIAPLLIALKKRPNLAADGRTRVLIGNETFSAAVIFAAALKKELDAILVGEATGGGLTVYADPQPLKLSEKGLVVMYPRQKVSAWFRARGPLAPDVLVKRSSYQEFCRDHDPQIAAAAGVVRPR